MDEEIRFDSLNLSTRISNSLSDMGFEVLTPVQAQVIPPALEGHDILATAQTGTGKTAAYGIPILQLRRRALVLTPTRELALQVQRDLDDMCGRTVPSVCLIGGAPFRDQKRVLKKRPDSNVVATPGRLCDHIDRGTVNLDDIELFVLDEADEMLSMGFSDDLNRITRAMPRDRQTMLLAATMPKSVDKLAAAALYQPVKINVGGTRARAADTVLQSVLVAPKRNRAEAIERLIIRYDPEACIVFCKTRNRTEELAKELSGIGAEALHGGYPQKHRDSVMTRFRNGQCSLLVATDVASRGLDVLAVNLVIQDDMPQNSEVYVHRVGRTGRAGREGRSILIVSKGVKRRIGMLRKVAGHIEDEPMPSEAEINELVTLRLVDEIIENEPGEVAISTFDRAVESGLDAQDIALAALQMLVHESQSANGNGSMNGTTALALGVGKVDRVRPKDLVAVVCNEGGLKGDKIGQIDLLDRISVVEVPTADIAMLLSALSGSRIRGRWLKPRHADDWDFAPRY